MALEIPKAWTFKNKNVADNFDAHVREQLPWYDMVTDLTAHIGRHYLTDNCVMYDIGASTGNITLSLKETIEKRGVKAISIDNSKEMVDIWRGVGTIVNSDALDLDYEDYSFGVCFLVLMFLSPKDQVRLLETLYNRLQTGGALLIVDRTQTAGGYIGTAMHRYTMAAKLKAGTSPKDVMDKEMSLAGVQRPLNYERLLAPYSPVEVFRMCDFAAWVITKEDYND